MPRLFTCDSVAVDSGWRLLLLARKASKDHEKIAKHGVFAVTSEAFIDLANQTGQTEIGGPGQIDASVETVAQKLGHVGP